MLSLQQYKNKKIAIYGLGITGQSVARVLKKFKSKIYCWDDNKNVRKKTKRLPLKKFWLDKKLSLDAIVISPGIDIKRCKIKKFLEKNNKNIITDLDIFFELNKKNLIISITGTNGKSTTCKIIEKILKTAKYNVETVGNIGKPILSINKTKKKDAIVLEVSSYQLEYSKLFRSKHAAILNISPDHLERHKNIKNYTKIKTKIFYAQKKSDYSYINNKNRYSKKVKNIFKSKKLKSKLVLVEKNDCMLFLKRINNNYFKTNSGIENFSFAYKIAKNLKIKDNHIIQALNNFKGLPHRQEIVFQKKNLVCINDSKATSFDATLQCLLNYNKVYWIVGGLPKKKDYFNLKDVSKKIIKAYIIGKKPNFFKKQIKNKVPNKVSYSIKKALQDIKKDLKSSKNKSCSILFSPASASFDQFSNFKDRGDYFKRNAIKILKKETYV